MILCEFVCSLFFVSFQRENTKYFRREKTKSKNFKRKSMCRYGWLVSVSVFFFMLWKMTHRFCQVNLSSGSTTTAFGLIYFFFAHEKKTVFGKKREKLT